jgi:UDP-N-acetylmuramate--alanine ligase
MVAFGRDFHYVVSRRGNNNSMGNESNRMQPNSAKSIYHFIGIGGIGMSGLARILLQKGYHITGSDRTQNEQITQLKTLGAEIYQGHQEEHVPSTAVVVYSNAISEDNPEFAIARARRQKMYTRAELLDRIVAIPTLNPDARTTFDKGATKTIAVTGTHGKTTTSSILAQILRVGEYDPTYIIGGILPGSGLNAEWGRGNYCVYEACEAFGSIHAFSPQFFILLNIDDDHMEYYHTMDNLADAFMKALNRLPKDGLAIINGDDKPIESIQPHLTCTYKTVGFSEHLDYQIVDAYPFRDGMSFSLISASQRIRDVRIPLVGMHNVHNSACALALLLELDIPEAVLRQGLATFKNADRRFRMLGTKQQIMVVDDYAHHPSEVGATLEGALHWKEFHSEIKRVVTVFQPHLYTRTRDHYQEFARILSQADLIMILPIYPSREKPLPGITADLIVKKLHKEIPHERLLFDSQHMADGNDIPTYADVYMKLLREQVNAGDLVIFMGAGDISHFAHQFFACLDS